MRILEKEFIQYGFLFVQLVREGNIAVYEKYLDSTREFLCCYEVIVIKEQVDHYVNDILYSASELYPSDSKWGLFGFTHKSYVNAMAKYSQLILNKNTLLSKID